MWTFIIAMKHSRRTYLSTVGALLGGVTAGCGDRPDGSAGGTETRTTRQTRTNTALPTDTPSPTSTPTATPPPIAYTVGTQSITVDGSLDDLSREDAIDLSGDGIVRGVGRSTGVEVALDGGLVWFTYDADALYVSAEVADDTHYNQETDQNWNGDALQIGVTPSRPAGATSFSQYDISLTGEEPVVNVVPELPSVNPIRQQLEDPTVRITRSDGATVYEVALPWALDSMPIDPSADTFGMAFSINNRDDDEGPIQWLSWTNCAEGGGIIPRKDPACFYPVELE